MCPYDVFDQLWRANEKTDPPARRVEVLAGRADCEGESSCGGGKGGDSGEGGVAELVIDLCIVRQ